MAAQGLLDAARREFADVGDQRCAVCGALAEQAWARLHVVQDAGELLLDQRSFLFDDDQLFHPLGEVARALGFDWPGESNLVDRQAAFARLLFVDAELFECLTHIEIGLAGGDDAEPLAG